MKWVSTVFWEINAFEVLEPGEYFWFTDIKDFPEFGDAVFPFALPMGHANHRLPREVVRPGFVGAQIVKDLIKFATGTAIAVDRIDGGTEKITVLEQGPTCLFRPLQCPIPDFFPARELWESSVEGIITHLPDGAFDMEMEPLFTDFRARLIVPERIEFSHHTKICISIDAYKGIASPSGGGGVR